MSRSLEKNAGMSSETKTGLVHENITLPMIFKELSCPYGIRTLSIRCHDQSDRNERYIVHLLKKN